MEPYFKESEFHSSGIKNSHHKKIELISHLDSFNYLHYESKKIHIKTILSDTNRINISKSKLQLLCILIEQLAKPKNHVNASFWREAKQGCFFVSLLLFLMSWSCCINNVSMCSFYISREDKSRKQKMIFENIPSPLASEVPMIRSLFTEVINILTTKKLKWF